MSTSAGPVGDLELPGWAQSGRWVHVRNGSKADIGQAPHDLYPLRLSEGRPSDKRHAQFPHALRTASPDQNFCPE